MTLLDWFTPPILAFGVVAISLGSIVALAQTPVDDQRQTINLKPWTGDLDGMVTRRVIRVATTYNRTHYFIDRGAQRGALPIA